LDFSHKEMDNWNSTKSNYQVFDTEKKKKKKKLFTGKPTFSLKEFKKILGDSLIEINNLRKYKPSGSQKLSSSYQKCDLTRLKKRYGTVIKSSIIGRKM